jgi:integral membrane protein
VRVDPLRLSVTAYRVMAYVTGVMLMILVFVGLPLQFFAHNDVIAKYVGTAHGVLYIIYLVVAFAMTRMVRIPILSVTEFLVLLAGTVPVLTFVIERWISRRYIEPALNAAGEGPAREHPVLR